MIKNLNRSKYKLAVLLNRLPKIRYFNRKSTFKKLLKAVSLTTSGLRPLARFLAKQLTMGRIKNIRKGILFLVDRVILFCCKVESKTRHY